MRVVAAYALHYGKEWIYHSMRSIRPYVDDIVVVYTPVPSTGVSGQEWMNPDTKEQLQEEVEEFDVHWREGTFRTWGEHVQYAVAVAATLGRADIVLNTDHDEIWPPEVIEGAIRHIEENMDRGNRWRIRMRHFWRSLSWICDDHSWPMRFYTWHKAEDDPKDAYLPEELGRVYHMGYAQTRWTVDYKTVIHGHRAEFRPGWYSDIFLPWQPGDRDVHPTSVNFWDPEPFDREQIKHLVGDHPFYDLDIIA